MLNQLFTFFMSAFRFPHLSGTLLLLSIAIGLAFAVAWLLLYRPNVARMPWLLPAAALRQALPSLEIKTSQSCSSK